MRSAPDSTSITSRRSRAERTSGPTTSKSNRSCGRPPARGTRPRDGFNPISPVYAAGRRIEPPPSVPSATGANPAATAATDPPLDPPGVSVGAHGLPVTPNRALAVYPSIANSGVLVLPSKMAPAARTRATGNSSRLARALPNIRLPKAAGIPAATRLSFMATGTPSNGPTCAPRRQRSVLASASALASGETVTKAPSCGSRRAMRFKQVSTTATGDRLPSAKPARSAVASRRQVMTRPTSAKGMRLALGPRRRASVTLQPGAPS